MSEDVARPTCKTCQGSGMVAYWDGSAYAGEMCPDCGPTDDYDAPDEEMCADCGRSMSGEDVCGVCGASMCFACFEMGCGVCKGPHK